MLKKKIGLLMGALFLTMILFACGNNDAANGNSNSGGNTVSLATYPPGLAFNSAASGVATVVSEQSDLKMNIRTFTSPDAWLPMLDKGEVDLGFTDSTSQWHYKGTAMAADEPMSNLRTIVTGNRIINVGFVAREDSDVNSLADLKGRKIGDYKSNEEAIAELLNIQLESVGLSYEDGTSVPVSGVEQGMDLLRSNKADVTFGGAPDAGLFLDVDSTVGIKGFSYGDYDVDQIEEVREKHGEEVAERYPNGELVVAEGGFLDEPIIAIDFPTVLLSHDAFAEEKVYEITKTLFENYEELQPLFNWLEDWEPDTMFTENPPVPYHDGAIKYFEEAGLWTNEAKEHHEALLNEVN
ncbi:MAG TPA: TAXI family TRAP transporter solute-binding subunit [Pseudogracilibacillus sp.]|nr:TAXI family TRAP transporter solute-binding subunit [Pseudogracilibacillus sp.]